MNDTTTAENTAAATTETAAEPVREVAIETASKEEIYTQLGEEIQALTGKRVGKTGGRKVFDSVVEKIFAAASKNGTFRFNAGFGSMHIREYGAGTRRLPSGQEVQFGERKKLRYEEGVVVQALVENGGNLAEAVKARGSRAAAPVEQQATATAGATAEADLDS